MKYFDGDQERVEKKLIYCSFCGKSQSEVKKLIAGPSVYICDECTDLCFDIIEEEGGKKKLRRTIRFEPQFAQAGISVLSNFARVISQKYPDVPVEVSIEQDGVNVYLTIITPTGEMERIQEALDQYGQVVQGSLSPNEFLPNPMQAQELKTKLEISALELRMTKELHAEVSLQQAARIESLESQVSQLNNLIGNSLSSSSSLHSVTMVLAQAKNKETEIERAVAVLLKSLCDTSQSISIDRQKNALETIKEKDQNLYNDIRDVVKNTIANIGASAATGWLGVVFNSLPK